MGRAVGHTLCCSSIAHTSGCTALSPFTFTLMSSAARPAWVPSHVPSAWPTANDRQLHHRARSIAALTLIWMWACDDLLRQGDCSRRERVAVSSPYAPPPQLDCVHDMAAGGDLACAAGGAAGPDYFGREALGTEHMSWFKAPAPPAAGNAGGAKGPAPVECKDCVPDVTPDLDDYDALMDQRGCGKFHRMMDDCLDEHKQQYNMCKDQVKLLKECFAQSAQRVTPGKR